MLTANQDYTLNLTMQGAAVTVTLNGTFIGSWGFNAAIVDGAAGVFARSGSTSFDRVRIRTNDPAFAAVPAGTALSVRSTASAQADPVRTKPLQSPDTSNSAGPDTLRSTGPDAWPYPYDAATLATPSRANLTNPTNFQIGDAPGDVAAGMGP